VLSDCIAWLLVIPDLYSGYGERGREHWQKKLGGYKAEELTTKKSNPDRTNPSIALAEVAS